MTGPSVGFIRYRLAATWRSRRNGYLTMVLLVGLLGGLAMGAVAAARRTQSSFPVFYASTNPSQLGAVTGVDNPLLGNGKGFNAPLVAKIARLPHVESVANGPGIDIAQLKADGSPVNISYLPISAGNGQGSLDGEGITVDKLAVLEGRLPSPSAVDEFVTLASGARAFGFHVGEVVSMGIYTNAQTEQAGFGTAAVKPVRRIDMKLVGIVTPAASLVADDVDQVTELGYFTPALTRQLLGCCVNFTETAIRTSPRFVGQVVAELSRTLPKGFPIVVATGQSPVVAKAERAVKPESIALGVFGGIAGLAALLIVGQTIGRQLRLRSEEFDVLRALGAGPTTIAADGLTGTLGALVVGDLLAVAIAVGLSPLAPLGPVRPVYPFPGVSFDWAVLGLGAAALLASLGALAAVLAVRGAPHRVVLRRRVQAEHSSVVSRIVGTFNLRPPAAAGIRFALEPGSGRNTVPVRSAILGTALAVIALITTVTFGASLDRLVATPRLYGWNWSYDLASAGGDVPSQLATKLLHQDKSIAAYSGVYFASLPIDGHTIPVIGAGPHAAVQPPILHGHRLDGPNQIVLGPLTLAQLHKKIGDTVTVGTVAIGSGTARAAALLRIVGIATMPAIGEGQETHLEMGSGALLPASLIPPLLKNPFNDPQTGPNAYFIDIKPGADPGAARRSLQAMTGPLTTTANFGVSVIDVLRPAEIVNYRAVGTTPAILGSALGAGAVVALALTLFASVRRRRRDLALLKTLGFTRGQMATTVAWQSNVAVAIGTVVGVPLGIVAGRLLWDTFAHEINAVPSPVVPALSVLLIALGALVLANAISYLPGRLASATPTAVLLRTE